ncbi:bifunctional DedA family/phosphatase PAP2 family protein [Varunaivibrio sulfuroxidans]|uniref:Undecaprenyl-diphosphatase n=1 Tax=Varunaivibrio sulfuroxidans TaxID=1773489 RepID=A0A4R3JFX3_9PROT|nr:bifunctional DedA family/phosphatase PAP2 family protein [Varunaivibrio sulfuroxidans]TCS64096.1 undecaprenyl-diphosphatase [Varunaivibrio sulfuroxidans]WES31455.1 LssY C-terminal domain-containing protein [Varunaivibrio sulfuroxidans]
MNLYIHHLVSWVGAHPNWSGLVVVLIAFSESLAIVGLIVPGSVTMFAVGALVAAGALNLWSTLAWAALGAALGDGASYWLGHRFHEQIRGWWPFSRYPGILQRGEAFFTKHGGKSVLMGRFVGPVRPVIPVVAGMMGMAPGRFFVVNIISALGWAPAYLMPGVVFGASLALAGQVAGRLAVLLGGIVLVTWLLVWLARFSYRHLVGHAQSWGERLLAWSKNHPHGSWLVSGLVDPERPEWRSLLLWTAILIGGSWLFLGVGEDVVSRDPLVYANQSIYHALQGLRTPLGDQIVIVFSALGERAVIIPVVLGILAWMVWRRAWRDALYWLAAAGFGALMVTALKIGFAIPRPTPLYSGSSAYAFPSAHTAMVTVVYGFAAVLSAPLRTPKWRWAPYALAMLIIVAVAFSRLYLGAHWLSDVIGGMGLGGAWVALLTIARRRHGEHTPRLKGLGVLALILVVVSGAWYIRGNFNTDLKRYAAHVPVRELPLQKWWNGAWRQLPTHRIDMAGFFEQPLNLQWAGKLDRLSALLQQRGWRPATPLSVASALSWVRPRPTLEMLPVLPQVHDGTQERLLLVKPTADGKHRLILRVWRSNARIAPTGPLLWLGSVARQKVVSLPLITYAGQSPGGALPLDTLAQDLAQKSGEVAIRRVTFTARDAIDKADGRATATPIICLIATPTLYLTSPATPPAKK